MTDRFGHPYVRHYIIDDERRRAEQLEIIIRLWHACRENWNRVVTALTKLGWNQSESMEAVADAKKYLLEGKGNTS